jgi:hypothetical protein
VTLHRDTGTVIRTVALAAESKVIMHDPTLARLYVVAGPPEIVDVVGDHRLRLLETILTGVGAHTLGWTPDPCWLCAFLPSTDRAAVYVEQ